MCRERVIFMVAGVLILSGLGLGYLVHSSWLLLSAFVGLNMFQASLSGFCPLAKILRAAGVPECSGATPVS